MTSKFETYATKICRHAKLPPRRYESEELNAIVMVLPLAESHAALDDIELEGLPRLGETVTLNQHVQANFFNVLGDPSRDLWEFTKPVLIKRPYLERLEGWRDWRSLAVYLAQEDLQPVAVFRNTPISIKTGTFEATDYYVADIRVALEREEAFAWRGE